MKDTLFYSQYCQNCVSVLKLISTNAKLADRICFLSIDGDTEDSRSKIREFLYILQVDEVPTLMLNDKKYSGVSVSRIVNQMLSGKPAPPNPKLRVPPPPQQQPQQPNHDSFPTIMRNVSKLPLPESSVQETFVGNSAGDSGYARFGAELKEPMGNVKTTEKPDLPPELIPVNTKEENAKENDMDKRLQALMAERAEMTKAIKNPHA